MKTCADLLGPELAAATVSIDDAPFALIALRGPDAGDFLHRLCSQDVAAMAVGKALPAAFLTAKGKLESVGRIARLGDRWLVEAQAHEREKVAALLERYHFAEKLAIDPPSDLICAMVLGPGAADGHEVDAAQGHDEVMALSGARRGLRWVRTYRPRGTAAPASAWPRAGVAEWHLRRIAAGIPWMGVDADGSTLAMEAALDDHISTTKGCYTGQEIVARIQTYGHVNRGLSRLVIDGIGAVAPGTSIEDDDGIAVGRALSVMDVPMASRRLALGYLPREFCRAGVVLRLEDGSAVHVVP